MQKRVLVNLNPPDQEPYWAFVPTTLVSGAPPPPPKYTNTFTPQQKRDGLAPRAFANPNSHGYGGQLAPWPFDHARALSDGRYRAGIRNAIASNWTASNWKYVARAQLQQILDILLYEYESDE